jgi:hypothetical protein
VFEREIGMNIKKHTGQSSACGLAVERVKDVA